MQRCGPFTLIDALAEGGMGEVWLAAPQGIVGAPDLVVLKRIKSELADDDGAVTRFVDESRLGLLLRHPCISRTIDAGRADGSDYLAAELVEGIDLANLLGRAAKAKQRIEPLLSCWMMAMALDGLDYAHQAKHPVSGQSLGVVHRDISPANLMATRDGVVRVIDFGLALSSVRQAQTMMGVVLGKLGYMAPEQARGQPVGPPCDVFAAGVVLYELIIGKRHYGGLPRERLATVVAQGKFRAALADEVDLATSGLFSAMTLIDPAARPTAAQARDVLLAQVEHLGGVDLATQGVAALIQTFAKDELARVDAARDKARALPPYEPAPTSGPHSISIAISESQAVQALLDNAPPVMTRESNAAITLAPGQMWQASPSLLNIAQARVGGGADAAATVDEGATFDDSADAADTVSIRQQPAPSAVASASEAMMAAAETTAMPQAPRSPSSSPSSPSSSPSSVPRVVQTATVPLPAAPRTKLTPMIAGGAVGVALLVGIVLGAGFGGADDDGVGDTAGSVASAATSSTDAGASDADVGAGHRPATSVDAGPDEGAAVGAFVAPLQSDGPSAPPSQPPAPPPAPPPPAPPAPPAPPKVTKPIVDPLYERVRRLARCQHACAGTFAKPAKTGIGSYSADRRRVLEGLATNCERFCP